MPAVETYDELTALLRSLHDDLRALLPDVLDTHGAERRELFVQACQRLALHDAVERLLLHRRRAATVAGAGGPGTGDPAADGPTVAQAPGTTDAVGRMVAELEGLEGLEGMAMDSMQFEGAFRGLADEVLDHADRQEAEEFGRATGPLPADDQPRAERAVELANALGEGFTLGGTYADMVSAAREELS